MERRGTRVAGRKSGLGEVFAVALVTLMVTFLMPLPLLGQEPLYVRGSAGDAKPENIDMPSTHPTAARDRGRAVRLQMEDGSVEELTMEEYLWGVVAAEMPAGFEEEALKAQTCAARTYTVIRQGSGKHPNADICADSTCCQAYVAREDALTRWGLNAKAYEEKIARAVAETDGLGILYQGTPIQALFFSSAPGQTVDAVEVWGNAVDYLVSVASPEGEEVPNYRTRMVLSAQEVKALTLAAYPGADLSGDPSGWFRGIRTNGGGTVSSLVLGGISLTGGQVRGLFALRSAAFTVDWDGTNFTFDVTGYGHGVGMSQYGANAMAEEGKGFRDILTWYYTGTDVDYLW